MRWLTLVAASSAAALVVVVSASGKIATGCTATTTPATGVTASGATLNGMLAGCFGGETYVFDYGLTAAYGTSTGAVAATNGAKAAAIGGLAACTTYNFRIRASLGSAGANAAFTTLGCGPAPQEESADVGVVKTASPTTVTVGDLVTYTEVVSSNGPQQAFNVVLTDTLPAGLSLVSVATTKGSCNSVVQCTLGDMPKGTTATVTIVVRTTRVGRIVNTAGVGATNPDPNVGANQRSQAAVEVAMLPADLALTLAAPSRVRFPNRIFYDAIVTNRGPAPATGVVLSLGLSKGSAALVSAIGCGVFLRITCSLGSLAPGASRTVRVVYRPRRKGEFVNVGQVSGNEPDPVPANNSAARTTIVVQR